MRAKSAGQITADLVAAAVDLSSAKTVSGAATLRGENAKKFIKDNKLEAFGVTELAQKKLFEVTYAAEEQSARGVCDRASTKYGRATATNCIPQFKNSLST
jgi:hypothetical protein